MFCYSLFRCSIVLHSFLRVRSRIIFGLRSGCLLADALYNLCQRGLIHGLHAILSGAPQQTRDPANFLLLATGQIGRCRSRARSCLGFCIAGPPADTARSCCRFSRTAPRTACTIGGAMAEIERAGQPRKSSIGCAVQRYACAAGARSSRLAHPARRNRGIRQGGGHRGWCRYR